MIEATGPYAGYRLVSTRARNVEWLGKLPAHWELRGSKWLFRTRDERARAEDEQLSATQSYGVILQKEYERKVGRKVVQILQHLDKRRHVEVDDFVISMRSFQGGLERAWSSGAIRSSYVVLQPTGPIDVGYFSYLFKCTDYIAALQRTSSFIRDGQDLNFNNFRMVDLPVVPLEEQRAISKFLDHADRRIRRYIRAKQKLIKLLEEQKQAIIHQAVTRGLNPNVKLKPSGVPWLGDVPEHWATPLNQRIFKENIRPHGDNLEVPLSLSQRDGLIATTDMKERSLKTSTYDNWKLALPGDLVVNRFKAHLGVFFASTLRGIVSFHYGVFEPRSNVSSKFFELLYHTAPYRAIYAGRSNGMTVGLQNLSNQNFYNVRTLVPPLDEQESIVEFAQQSTAEIQKAISRAAEEIGLLKEYRTRLISDVVTGKLDVRQAAASLPDERSEDEPLEEVEEELDEDAEEAGEEGDE